MYKMCSRIIDLEIFAALKLPVEITSAARKNKNLDLEFYLC